MEALTRISSGIPGLDNLLEGGFIEGSSNLITGSTGTGKTIFCVQFALSCLKNNQRVVYLTFEERSQDVLNDVVRFGWKNELKEFVQNGKLFLESRVASNITDISKGVPDLLK